LGSVKIIKFDIKSNMEFNLGKFEFTKLILFKSDLEADCFKL